MDPGRDCVRAERGVFANVRRDDQRRPEGEPGPACNATLLGAAVILEAARRVPTLAEGVDLAMKSLESGAARAVLVKLKS